MDFSIEKRLVFEMFFLREMLILIRKELSDRIISTIVSVSKNNQSSHL